MKRPLYLVLAVLLLIPTSTIGYRVIWLRYPLLPTVPGGVWQFSVKAEVKGGRKGIRVAVAVPLSDGGQTISDEQIASGTLDFALAHQDLNRLGIWSSQSADAQDSISYGAQILLRNRKPKPVSPPLSDYPKEIDPEERGAAEKLASRWTQLRPEVRLRAIVESREHIWQPLPPSDPNRQLWSEIQKKYGAWVTLVILCRAAGLPARLVQGFPLAEGVYTAPLSWVEVWTGKQWENVRISTGEIYPSSNSNLALARNVPAVQLLSGSANELQWTLTRQRITSWNFYFQSFARSDRWLDQWSLFRLPAEFQDTFRILLLIPISALLIGFLRNVVGFPTFGIFMPVLMALAFRNTGLIFGLSVFAFVITVGYVFRRVLNDLRLLLVPRLSVLLSVVVTSLTIMALIGNKVGLRPFMAVGLLPIVILTMTIERFFVIVEEAGVREGLRTAAGSAAVASLTYEIIHWESLQLTFFLYPELIGVIAALQVMLGRYTGFRLGELSRFWEIRKGS